MKRTERNIKELKEKLYSELKREMINLGVPEEHFDQYPTFDDYMKLLLNVYQEMSQDELDEVAKRMGYINEDETILRSPDGWNGIVYPKSKNN